MKIKKVTYLAGLCFMGIFLFTACGDRNSYEVKSSNSTKSIKEGESISSLNECISGRELIDKMGDNLKLQATIKGTILSSDHKPGMQQVYIDMGDGSTMTIHMAKEIQLADQDLSGRTLYAMGTAYIDTSYIDEKIYHDPDDVDKPRDKTIVPGDQSEPDVKFIATGIIIR